MSLETRTQNYSRTAYRQILELNSISEPEKKRYGSLCHRVPIMILQNGLMQTIGFLKGKATNENGRIDPTKAESLLIGHLALQLNFSNIESFFESLFNSNIVEYQIITRNILAMSIWYKRFAESLLGVSNGSENS